MPKSDPPTFYDHPGSLLELGLLNIEQGKHDTAWNLARKILADRPNDKNLVAIAHRLLSKGVDNFHHPMLQDTVRNSVYHAAIKRAAPGKVVLDIGTGSGLLSMMAAKAGAKQVIACEANAILANTAREIVAVNGLSDRITIHNLRSDALDRAEHLGGGADLVISEIFSLNLVGEGVLPSLEHARTELCKPDAVFLPAKASIRIALASFPMGLAPIGTVEGFDLSAFNQITTPFELVPAGSDALILQSEPADLFAFDFSTRVELPMIRETQIDLQAHAGQIDGIAQWLHIDFGDGLVYENAPGGPRELHWPIQYVPLAEPRKAAQGDTIRIGGRHTRNLLMLWDD